MSCPTFQPGHAKLFSEIIKRTQNFILVNTECRFQWILSNEDKDINKINSNLLSNRFLRGGKWSTPNRHLWQEQTIIYPIHSVGIHHDLQTDNCIQDSPSVEELFSSLIIDCSCPGVVINLPCVWTQVVFCS